MKSMTGHGTGRATRGDASVEAEIKAVNHRQLEVKVHSAPETAAFAAGAEDAVRAQAQRGHVSVWLRADRASQAAFVLDRDRAAAAYRALQALRDELAPGDAVPFSMLAGIPQVWAPSRASTGDSELGALVRDALAAALVDFDAARKREGAALRADLSSRLAALRELHARVSARTGAVVTDHHARLRERVSALLSDARAALDESRLAQEVALLAERMDVTEEVVRLAAHFDAFATTLDAEDGTAGRKLDFLLQEMARETNTIGSKSADLEITHAVLDMKAEIARLREQAQNVL